MGLSFEAFGGERLGEVLDDLSRLRVAVFRDWPYLYDGDPGNEAGYLRSYQEAEGVVVVVARDGERIVGCASGMPMAEHEDVADVPLGDLGLHQGHVFYCAESVLLPQFRGQGAGHAFFDLREAHAREMGFGTSLFCAVERPQDHPARPDGARSLEPFWRKRGYERREASVAMTWTDLGDESPTEKRLRVWTCAL